jgi:hypothetical protein
MGMKPVTRIPTAGDPSPIPLGSEVVPVLTVGDPDGLLAALLATGQGLWDAACEVAGVMGGPAAIGAVLDLDQMDWNVRIATVGHVIASRLDTCGDEVALRAALQVREVHPWNVEIRMGEEGEGLAPAVAGLAFHAKGRALGGGLRAMVADGCPHWRGDLRIQTLEEEYNERRPEFVAEMRDLPEGLEVHGDLVLDTDVPFGDWPRVLTVHGDVILNLGLALGGIPPSVRCEGRVIDEAWRYL